MLGMIKTNEHCKECISCKDSWSANMSLSCHEFCDKFQAWKRGGLNERGNDGRKVTTPER